MTTCSGWFGKWALEGHSASLSRLVVAHKHSAVLYNAFYMWTVTFSKWNIRLSREFCGGCRTAQAETNQPSFLPSFLFLPLSSFLPSLLILYFIFNYLKLFLKINLFYLICIYLPACMSVYYMQAWYYGRAEEGVGFPETGVIIDKSWSTMWVLELNLGALEKYPGLLPAELALQPTFWWWWWWWLWWWQGFM